MADSSGPKPITDIAKPGKTTPAASSRPIIVSHTPTVQDPMMSFPVTKSENTFNAPVSHTPQPATPAPPAPQQPSTIQPPQQPIAPSPSVMPPDPHVVKQLVHDKTYFMPVTQPPRRHGLPWLFILPVALAVAAIAYILLR